MTVVDKGFDVSFSATVGLVPPDDGKLQGSAAGRNFL